MGNDDKSHIKTDHGITTGTAATAAALAAFLSINRNNIRLVKVNTPLGKLKIDIENSKKLTDKSGTASVIKRPYNDPDVTKNVEIFADVKIIGTPEIKINGGEGVGIVTKPGLQVAVGEYAINPVPRKMIKSNLKHLIPNGQGLEVTIFVPNGKEIAKRTMNSRLGIIGGISILGTTGIARPMSLESYKESLKCQIDVAIAQGYKCLVFVPGNIGEKVALQILNVKKDQIIQMGNYVGYMLEEASKKGVERITLLGHAGKLVKIAAGIFNTKHRIADGRREVITAYSALYGANKNVINRIFESKTTEEMINILDNENLVSKVFKGIAETIRATCQERFNLDFEVIIVNMNGEILNN
jgi:cobalt-precorrin-5B (C1)-methyltransferase